MEKDGRVALALATAAYAGGRAAEAVKRLGTANDAPALYLRGLCLATQGSLLKAAASFQELADRHPNSPLRDPALFCKADAFFRSRAYGSAAEEFTRVRERVQRDDLRAEADLRAAAAVQLSGKPDSALVRLRAVVDAHAGTDVAARGQFLIGEILKSQQQCQEAIREYNRVLTSYFEHEVAASAQYRVARCLDALGRRAEAMSAYQAVVSGYALSPESPAAAYLAGVGLLERGKPLQAAPYFQLVLDRYTARSDSAGAFVFATPAHQELVEAALCLLELSYHRAGDLGQLSGAPHLLLQRMPPSRSPWRAYAQLIDADAQAALGRYAETQATLQRLTRDFPDHEIGLAANQLLAWTHARAGHDSLAIATEERMLARYAKRGDSQRLASAHLHLAHVRFNQKRYREAATGYEDFLRRFPQHSQRLVALYQAGLCYVRLDRAGDAVDRWEAIVRDSSTAAISERAWARAGDLYFQAERYNDAKRCYTGLLTHFSGTRAAGIAALRLAQCAYNAGDDAAAIAGFAEVIARFPETPFEREATRGTEQALFRLGRKPQGRATLARLVEEYPTSAFAADAQFEIARQLYAEKKWDEAAEAYRRLVSQFPASAHADQAQLLLGECSLRAGQPDAARAAYEQFLAFFPSSPLRTNVLFQMASMRFEAQDYAQAAVHFTQVLEDSTSAAVRAATLFNLAQCQRQIGSTADARATLDRYMREHPNDERAAQVGHALGDLDEAAGELEQAESRYMAALAAKPDAALATELRYRIGRCREARNDAEGALRAYKQAAAAPDAADPYRLSALARCATLYEASGERTRAVAAYRDIARNARDPELAAAAAGRVQELQAGGDSEDAAPPVPKAKKTPKRTGSTP
jgi:TolA-binding protein